MLNPLRNPSKPPRKETGMTTIHPRGDSSELPQIYDSCDTYINMI